MVNAKHAVVALSALALLAATQTGAQAQTLQDLITNGTPVVSGDIVYNDFSSGGTLPASDITVNFTSVGVQFTGNWNTLTPGANGAVIGYTASVSPQVGGQITGSGLFFAGQVIVGAGSASVGETLTDATTQTPYSMQVNYDGPGAANNKLNDSVTFNPAVTSLDIVKSIDVAADGPNSFAALNFVENTFVSAPGGGSPPPVPEPATLALIPLALFGLALRKKLAR